MLNPISHTAQRASCDDNNAHTCTRSVYGGGHFSAECGLGLARPAAQQLMQRMQLPLGLTCAKYELNKCAQKISNN